MRNVLCRHFVERDYYPVIADLPGKRDADLRPERDNIVLRFAFPNPPDDP